MLRIGFMDLGRHFIKSIVLIVALGSSQVQASEKLPLEADTRYITLPDAKSGKRLRVAFNLSLPATQKLNPYAHSFFAVYERRGNGWDRIKNIKLATKFSIGDTVDFDEDLDLNRNDSDIALHSTIYHCGKDNKSACYIQAFQGVAKRSANGQRQLKFTAQATLK